MDGLRIGSVSAAVVATLVLGGAFVQSCRWGAREAEEKGLPPEAAAATQYLVMLVLILVVLLAADQTFR